MHEEFDRPPVIKALDGIDDKLRDIELSSVSTASDLAALRDEVEQLKTFALDVRDAAMHGPWSDSRSALRQLVWIRRLLVVIALAAVIRLFQ